MEYKKIQDIKGNVRYIDPMNNWWKITINGKVTKSKPSTIIKEYGNKDLNIINEGVFGLRVNA